MADVGLDGRVAVVTGAAAGLGRAEALALAAAGADLVLGDVSPALADVAQEAEALGVKVRTVLGDVAETQVAHDLVTAAVEGHGRLDVVVNNAGFVRDRMLFGMSDDEWDSVVRVHLRGHFVVSRAAAAYWRDRSKLSGAPVYGRLVNTASEAWLFGAPGQPNYAAAKAGIAALTVAAARGLSRYGVRANVICPRARTAMTAGVFGDPPAAGVDPLSVEHVAPFVAYLASPAAEAVNGQVFVVHGGGVAHLAPPTVARRFTAAGELWTAEELAVQLDPYFAGRDPDDVFAVTELLG
ncbi:3-oxoacyl-ACP reductase [Spongisporangium articulatum]|uniref:3-oxoacyl-ACP reductase n=1 Tax=Spongisporangium articulatum TaxID=3362603 RepID=A0ABW8AV19_9ACTN